MSTPDDGELARVLAAWSADVAGFRAHLAGLASWEPAGLADLALAYARSRAARWPAASF